MSERRWCGGLVEFAATVGTMHVLVPPDREDYPSDEAYEEAYHQWYADTHFFRAIRTEES